MKRKNILKKSSRSVLSISMCIIILFGTLIIGGSANASTSNYSHSAAVDYAKKHWNDGVGLCAQFVAACITAGGISVSDKVCYNLYNSLKPYGTVYKLKTYGSGKNTRIRMADNSGKVSAGDPLFYVCETCGGMSKSCFPHVVLCGGVTSDGFLTAYAHNAAWNNRLMYTVFSSGAHSGHSTSIYSIHLDEFSYATAPTDPFITATATTVAVNEEVTFNYGATNATWYRFGSFRNGELSVTEVWSNTSHTTSFSEAGVYIIHVQCINKIGFADSEDIVITVYDSAPTDPFITATATTVAVNEEVTFNYGATNATWYRFGSFRNGELTVTEVWSNTSHTTSFSEAGVYIIHVQCMNKIGFVDSEDIVVTVYNPNSIVKIELNAVGGDCSISEISVNDSWPIGALPIPTRNGYNFDGWYTAASGGTKITEETIFSADTILYAHWSTCDHNYTVIESVDPSCTKEGSKTLKSTKCGNTYNEKIEKKAHTAVIDNSVAATCTTAGLTEGSHCSTCGTVIKARTTVPATGHTDMNNDGLCDKCGKSLAPTVYPKLSIRTPSVTTVSYGFTLNLHANVTDLPEGARVAWSMDGSGFELIPSADGMTCGVKSVSKGSATITAKVVDKNGNAVKDANGNEITASQQLTSKAGFFQKLVAFFKKLFGSNMVIPSSLNKLVK